MALKEIDIKLPDKQIELRKKLDDLFRDCNESINELVSEYFTDKYKGEKVTQYIKDLIKTEAEDVKEFIRDKYPTIYPFSIRIK